MRYDTLSYPFTIFRGTVSEEYIFVPSDDGGGQDFTSVSFTAALKDRPGGTTLATFDVNPNVAPPGTTNTEGWIQIRLDDSTSITAGYHRGVWSLTVDLDGANPYVVAAGPVDIVSLI